MSTELAADLETKIAILRRKAEAEQVTLPDNVAFFIASNIKSNIGNSTFPPGQNSGGSTTTPSMSPPTFTAASQARDELFKRIHHNPDDDGARPPRGPESGDDEN